MFGPITARIAGAVAAGLVGLLVSAGLDVTPELQSAVADFASTLVTVVTLAAYGVAHKAFAKSEK